MEGRVEKQSLQVTVKELSELQKLQQASVKVLCFMIPTRIHYLPLSQREALAHTAHSKAQAAFHKAETAFLAARSKYETAQATMNALGETLDI